MNKHLKVTVFLAIVSYLLGAFYSATFNIELWLQGTRAFSVIAFICTIFIYASTSYLHSEDRPKKE
jgi:hypothetical protein